MYCSTIGLKLKELIPNSVYKIRWLAKPVCTSLPSPLEYSWSNSWKYCTDVYSHKGRRKVYQSANGNNTNSSIIVHILPSQSKDMTTYLVGRRLTLKAKQICELRMLAFWIYAEARSLIAKVKLGYILSLKSLVFFQQGVLPYSHSLHQNDLLHSKQSTRSQRATSFTARSAHAPLHLHLLLNGTMEGLQHRKFKDKPSTDRW